MRVRGHLPETLCRLAERGVYRQIGKFPPGQRFGSGNNPSLRTPDAVENRWPCSSALCLKRVPYGTCSQMFEMGSLLRRLAQDYATTPVGLFGSLKNIAKRPLECFRNFSLTDEDFEAYPDQIRLCDPG
jgi:hypothetical protein